MLCALPNISIVKAQKILEKFKPKIVLCDKDTNESIQEDEILKTELMKIDGIGKGIYKKMSEYLY